MVKLNHYSNNSNNWLTHVIDIFIGNYCVTQERFRK